MLHLPHVQQETVMTLDRHWFCFCYLSCSWICLIHYWNNLALSQTRSQWVLASARAALYHRSCLWFSWTGYLGAAWGWSRSGLGVSGSPLCCLQMMWSCWHPQSVTAGIHWGVLQLSVKRRGLESAPPNLRPWCSAGDRWIAPSRWGQRAYPKQRSSSISGSCSRVRVRWSGRSTGGSVRLQQSKRRCTGPSWWRGSWADRQSSQFTGQSTFQPSPMVTNFGSWPKEQGREYKRTKWVSSIGWPGSALERGYGARTSGGSSESSRYSFALKGVSWGGPGIWFGRLPLEVFQAHPTGRRPRGRPRNTLEGLHLPAGLGTPRDPPEWVAKCCGWEGSLGQPSGSPAPRPDPEFRGWEWMDWNNLCDSFIQRSTVLYATDLCVCVCVCSNVYI